jgi:hypothetical protein
VAAKTSVKCSKDRLGLLQGGNLSGMYRTNRGARARMRL